ncbi:Bifunctional ligase/repressor BirA [bioreactor metagenome]|uniref:Bifunctional ligase/repressor BirA n=1 Tax=bioreactor metagenome TaxID=1076179 RepID=A0A645EUU7_9ZZZZ
MKIEPFFSHYEILDSTNDVALELLNKHQCVAVTAEFQRKGRGRNKKTWLGDAGKNLYYTFGINHNVENLPLYMLQIVGGLAVYNVLKRISTEIDFFLKYPNDIYGTNNIFSIVPKKLSGIISETNFIDKENCSSIIGIGINITQTFFPDEISNNVTSLALLGVESSIIDLRNKLTEEIIELISKQHISVFDEWKHILNLENKTIQIISDNFIDDNSGATSYYKLKKYLADGRLLLVSDSSVERIIDNGDSIRYDLI